MCVCCRCDEEDVEMGDEAKELLTKIGQETSLRYDGSPYHVHDNDRTTNITTWPTTQRQRLHH